VFFFFGRRNNTSLIEEEKKTVHLKCFHIAFFPVAVFFPAIQQTQNDTEKRALLTFCKQKGMPKEEYQRKNEFLSARKQAS
jgi:hypothetical protein